eukprot:TRINITY_DN2620_c0_g1_i2.p1 TRINITY_DN2620_c0_g1~~TRINITY_DN2620_c0_g1_i2.p1  ORF type:complete len:439 (-),score=41.54 TRINITY_DN2620_c0_g1_i2:18-1334(-)
MGQVLPTCCLCNSQVRQFRFRLGDKEICLSVPIGRLFQLDQFGSGLCRQLDLGPDQLVTGFYIDSSSPLCPLFLAPAIRKPDTHQVVVLPASQYILYRGPAPAPQEVLEVPLLELVAADPWFGVEADTKVAPPLLGQDLQDARTQIQERVMAAMRDLGFLRVVITANEQEVINQAWQAAASFFEQPMDIKRGFASHDPQLKKIFGFSAQKAREFFQVRRSEVSQKQLERVWPDRVCPHFSQRLIAVFQLLDRIARILYRIVCHQIGIDIHWAMQLLDQIPDSEGVLSPVSPQPPRPGADVMRLYRYLRPKSDPLPGLSRAATGLHADMGMITASPRGSLPGLVTLHPNCTQWIDAETSANETHISLFAGETLSKLCDGQIRPVLHFVDERFNGTPRFSVPFFLRGRPDAFIKENLTVANFVENTVMAERPWGAGRTDY